MKIAIILAYAVFTPSSGIVSQGLTWKKCLESRGHSVVLINMWEKNDWKSFNAIIFIGYSSYISDFINKVYKTNPNIIVAPVLDPDYSILKFKIYSNWGSNKLRLTNPAFALKSVKDKIKLFLVRSAFEQKYIVQGFNISINKCKIVPLAYGDFQIEEANIQKENFCLHISLLCDERKNVHRLIQAAQKYKFNLILAGKLRNADEEDKLNSWIGSSSNIQYKGFLNETDKFNLYRKAKVFALPSTNEGVGIVGLEAAVCGADIVLTNLGGPKEYYNGLATLVNPYDINDIGNAVSDFLNGKTYQPYLKQHITQEFSISAIGEKLERAIYELL